VNYPSIKTDNTPEQNIQSIKSHLYQVSDEYNYQIKSLQAEIEALKVQISNLKGDA